MVRVVAKTQQRSRVSRGRYKENILRWRGGYFLSKGASGAAMDSLKSSFHGPWVAWSMIPEAAKDEMFENFLNEFQTPRWEDRAEIRCVWNATLGARYGDTLNKTRAKQMKILGTTDIGDCRDQNPDWVSKENWNKMINHWTTPKWKAKSRQAAKNRQGPNQGFGIVKHSAGPIPFEVIKDRLAEMNNEHPHQIDLYDVTHMKNGEYIDERSKNNAEKYKSLMIEKYGKDETKHPCLDFDAWLEATGVVSWRRGVVGIGPRNDLASYFKYPALTSTTAQSSATAITTAFSSDD